MVHVNGTFSLVLSCTGKSIPAHIGLFRACHLSQIKDQFYSLHPDEVSLIERSFALMKQIYSDARNNQNVLWRLPSILDLMTAYVVVRQQPPHPRRLTSFIELFHAANFGPSTACGQVPFTFPAMAVI